MNQRGENAQAGPAVPTQPARSSPGNRDVPFATKQARPRGVAGARDQCPASENTREALLRAGRTLFAELGFEGASVRAITAAAAANLGAITYHFGSKEAFYDEVIEDSVAPFVDAVVGAVRAPGTPLERAEAAVRAYFDHLASHPEIPRLMLQGVLATGLPPAAALRHMRRLLGELVGVVKAGQAEGSIRGGDARVLALGMISQTVHVAMMRKPLKALAGIDFEDDETRRWLLEELVRFVRGGLAAERSEERQ